jgi:hypothetical protein
VNTAPSIAFTTVVTSAITVSPQVAAAVAGPAITGSTFSGSTFSDGLTKILSLLGGALAGGIVAIVAIFFASRIVQKKLSDEEQKKLLQNHTRNQIIWVLLSVVLFSASYQFTAGWALPVLIYSLFLAGLIAQQFKLMKLFKAKVLCDGNKGYVAGWAGLILGALVGFVAMILGLLNSGRLIL